MTAGAKAMSAGDSGGRNAHPTVAPRALEPLVAELERQGVSSTHFLRNFGVSPLNELDEGERIPATALVGIWDEAARCTGDPLFGLHAAGAVEAHTFGMFSYLAITSRTLREALERVCRYFRLLTDVLRYELIVREDVVTLACLPTTNVIPPSRQVSDFSVAVVHAYVRRAIPDWHLSETLLPYPTPSDTRAHLSFFGIEPRFGSSALALCFPRSFLERPLVRGDAKLAGLLEDVVSGSLAKLPSQPGFTARTHHALLLALKDGQASLGEVAKRLGTTPRTLQRRLADEGASFHGVLDECRRDLALPLLSGARLTVHEIAFAVGFSEPSAFQRAFRRWTGETPAHFRARQRTSPPD